jgi:hypothetical protein
VQIGREIAGKVGNSKKVIGQTRRFGQVWAEMVVLYFFVYFCYCYFWFGLYFLSSFLFCLFANALLLLMFQASSSFDGMAGKAKVADVYDAFGLADTMSVVDVLGKKSKKNSRKSSDPSKGTGAKKARLTSAEEAASVRPVTPMASPDISGLDSMRSIFA